MSKHTPGPWVAELDDGETPGHRMIANVLVGVKFKSPCQYIGGTRWAPKPLCEKTDDSWSQNDANARLIAAAPEMLEALKRAEDHFRLLPPEMDAPGSVMAEMRAAIAKAEGRS